jgi:hypothetical protein
MKEMVVQKGKVSMAASLYEVGLASPRCPPKPSPRCKKSVWPVAWQMGLSCIPFCFGIISLESL